MTLVLSKPVQHADVIMVIGASPTEAVRLRAADRLLEIGLRVVELHELQARVAEIEARLAPEGKT